MKIGVNESTLDRFIRAVVGLILFYLGVAGVVAGVLGIILAVVGAILLATAAVGFCPLYALLKVKTNKES